MYMHVHTSVPDLCTLMQPVSVQRIENNLCSLVLLTINRLLVFPPSFSIRFRLLFLLPPLLLNSPSTIPSPHRAPVDSPHHRTQMLALYVPRAP